MSNSFCIPCHVSYLHTVINNLSLKDKNGKATDQVPKIRITDENSCTVSYKSELSTSEVDNLGKIRGGDDNDDWKVATAEPLDLEFELNPTIAQKKAAMDLKPIGRKKHPAVPLTRGEKLRRAIRSTYVPVAMGFFMASCQLYDCLTRSILKINQGRCTAGEHSKDWMNLVILSLYRYGMLGVGPHPLWHFVQIHYGRTT